MTPEELEDCRAVLRRFQRGQISGDDVEYVEMMLSYIDQLGAQITTLKGILIRDRAERLAIEEILAASAEAAEIGVSTSTPFNELPASIRVKCRRDARQQLEEEHPEAMK